MPVKNLKLFSNTSLSERIDEAIMALKTKLYQLLFKVGTYLTPIIDYITDKKFKILHYLPWLDFVLRYSFILLVSANISNALILSLTTLPFLADTALFVFTCSICIFTHAKADQWLKPPKMLSYLLYLGISLLVCTFFKDFNLLFDLIFMFLLTPQSTSSHIGKKTISPLITTPIIAGITTTGLIFLFRSIPFWPLLAGITLITQVISEYLHIKKLAPDLGIKMHLKLILGSRDTCLHPVNYTLLTDDLNRKIESDTSNSLIQLETSNLFDDNTSPVNKREIIASISKALGEKASVTTINSKLTIKKKKRIGKKDLALIHPDRNRKHKKLYTELFSLLSSQITETTDVTYITSNLSYSALNEIKSLFATEYHSIIAIEQKLGLETSTFLSFAAQYMIVHFIRATIKLTSGKQQIIDFLRPGLDLSRESMYYANGQLIVGTKAESDLVNTLGSDLIATQLPEEIRAISC